MGNNNCCRLHVVGFGLALGVVWGAACFLMGLFAMGNYGVAFVNTIGSFYIGYTATFWGSIIGLIWGFVDAFIGGVVIAWLYNIFSKCCCKNNQSSSTTINS